MKDKNMLLYIGAVAILIIIYSDDVHAHHKLSINPNASELIINEGDKISIQCTSKSPIMIYYPGHDSNEIQEENLLSYQRRGKIFQAKFLKRNASYRDTGWHGCVDASAKSFQEGTGSSDTSWIYIYVKSEKHVFVEQGEGDLGLVRTLLPVVGSNIIIPCRATSPTYQVILRNTGSSNPLDLENASQQELVYDPMVGFTLRTDKIIHELISCISYDPPDLVSYVVSAVPKTRAPKPLIHRDNLRHVVSGQPVLRIDCSSMIGEGELFELVWSTPGRTEVNTVSRRAPYSAGIVEVTSELMMDNVTYDDEGDYFCTLVTTTDSASDRTYITVYDPEYKFIKLNAVETAQNAKLDEDVELVAELDAYPLPKIQWLNPQGQVIQGDVWPGDYQSKYVMYSSTDRVVLKITRVQNFDAGNYVLQGSIDEPVIIQYANFTINIVH